MKTLLTLVMALSLSQAYAQMSGTSAPASGVPAAGTSSTSGMMNTNQNTNRPANGMMNSNQRTNSNINNTNTTTDSIGTSQSSTTRKVLPNTPGTVTPANTNATGVNCVDRSGRNYGSSDTGYTACVNSMRMR